MDYEITYTFHGGKKQKTIKRADSRSKARNKLYLQLGSRFVDIVSIQKVAQA